MPCPPEDLSYIAGVIDSDGYIGLTKGQEYRRGNHITIQIRPVITLTQVQTGAIYFIRAIFPGHYYEHIRDGSKNWKTIYVWGLGRREDVSSFLTQILPYLKIKKRQAELVIAYCSLRESVLSDMSRVDKRGRPRRSSKYTYSGVEYEMWKAVKQLNKTGVTIDESGSNSKT